MPSQKGHGVITSQGMLYEGSEGFPSTSFERAESQLQIIPLLVLSRPIVQPPHQPTCLSDPEILHVREILFYLVLSDE